MNYRIEYEEYYEMDDLFGGDDIILATTPNRYFSGTEEIQPEKLCEILLEGGDESLYTFPVFCYIHSGIWLSMSTEYPFNDRWDSGLAGIISVPRDVVKSQEEAKKILQAYLEEYSKALNGEVYYYVILDEDDNVIDSCGGFIGYKVAEWAAKEALDCLTCQSA